MDAWLIDALKREEMKRIREENEKRPFLELPLPKQLKKGREIEPTIRVIVIEF